jgi:hypothetical protein
MTGWHVVGGSGVFAVAARSHVHGDPLALDPSSTVRFAK